MKRPDPSDNIHIRGQVYSIKKIQKLYQKDIPMYPRIVESMNSIWFCPSCNEFHQLDVYASLKDKYCSYCGQKIKWPRKKKKNIE